MGVRTPATTSSPCAFTSNACTRVVVEVSEYHGHYIDCRAPGVGNIIVASVNVRAGVVPRTEDGADSFVELGLRVGGEVHSESTLVLILELTCKGLKILCGELYIVMYALLFLHLVDKSLEVLLADLHDDVGEHLDKAAVGVVYEALKLRVGVAGYHGSHNLVVKTEVKYGVHHSGHGCARTRTDRYEKRVLEIAELLAVDLLHDLDILHDLSHDLVVDLSSVLIILCACVIVKP